MPKITEHTLNADIIQTGIVKSSCFILVDSDGNPVVEFRADEENTFQILDKHGNICTEIRLGQTPGKELRSS